VYPVAALCCLLPRHGSAEIMRSPLHVCPSKNAASIAANSLVEAQDLLLFPLLILLLLFLLLFFGDHRSDKLHPTLPLVKGLNCKPALLDLTDLQHELKLCEVINSHKIIIGSSSCCLWRYIEAQSSSQPHAVRARGRHNRNLIHAA
jgi:hypothetical protein